MNPNENLFDLVEKIANSGIKNDENLMKLIDLNTLRIVLLEGQMIELHRKYDALLSMIMSQAKRAD